MSTSLVYGSGGDAVELSYILTKSISFEPVYDETNTDMHFLHVQISVQAVFNAALAPAAPGESAAQTMARVRHKLLTPRRPLLLTVGGDELVRSPAADSLTGLDANNGPKPERCVITQIGGSTTFMVDYVVSTWLTDCAASSGVNYISHRWKDEVTIDENFYTTRTRTGMIRTRSDMLTNADALRGLVAAGTLLPGFRRLPSTYTLSEDGLTLRYTIVDREVTLQVPAPATSAEGTYTESSPQGAIRYAECSVKLTGAKTTDKGALLALTVFIALSRVRGNGQLFPLDPEGPKLMSAVVRVDMYNPVVEVMLRVLITATSARTAELPMDLRAFTAFPAGSDPNVDGVFAPDPGSRGSAGLTLVAAAMRDPCLDAFNSQFTSNAPSTSTLALLPVPAQVFWTAVLPTDQAALYAADNAGAYPESSMRNRYRVRTNKVGLATMTSETSHARVVEVQLGASQLVRETEWSVERIGSKPELPNPAPPNANTFLIETVTTAESHEPAPDGVSWKWKLSGYFVWGFRDASQVPIEGGILPWVNEAAARQADGVPSSNFTTQTTQGVPGDSPFSTLNGWRGPAG